MLIPILTGLFWTQLQPRNPTRVGAMPRYVLNFVVDGTSYSIIQDGQEFASLSEAHAAALRIFVKALPSIPEHRRASCRMTVALADGGTVLILLPPLVLEKRQFGNRRDDQ
jgi:hypothetical protein